MGRTTSTEKETELKVLHEFIEEMAFALLHLGSNSITDRKTLLVEAHVIDTQNAVWCYCDDIFPFPMQEAMLPASLIFLNKKRGNYICVYGKASLEMHEQEPIECDGVHVTPKQSLWKLSIDRVEWFFRSTEMMGFYL
ncbi:MAG: hypothetical protein C5B52_04465 [Bacteroidetes bacterium]|nr:MAG: hypothetical protein C5B52_04465 [Bacteroidota bacterium]